MTPGGGGQNGTIETHEAFAIPLPLVPFLERGEALGSPPVGQNGVRG
jgi:hypothetical protein